MGSQACPTRSQQDSSDGLEMVLAPPRWVPSALPREGCAQKGAGAVHVAAVTERVVRRPPRWTVQDVTSVTGSRVRRWAARSRIAGKSEKAVRSSSVT